MPPNVLVLCHGNRFRSPLAGAVLSGLLGADRVRTAGVKPDCKGRASPKVREYAETLDLDLNDHRSRTVTAEDFEWADVVVYMDEGNRTRALAMGASESKLVCLGDPKIHDPGFLRRGPKLTAILDMIVARCRYLTTERGWV